METAHWVVIGVLVVGLALVPWMISANKRSRAAEEERLQHRSEALRDAQTRLKNFEERQEEDWPVRHTRFEANSREYLMMSADQRRLRTLVVTLLPELTVTKEQVVSLETIVSVELQQSSETILKFETATTSKGSPLLRAAVGGLAFGGAGAVVGAVSAGKNSVGRSSGSTETRKGPVYLIVGTTDLHAPLMKLRMTSMSVAEEWLHRIRGAVAVQGRA